MPRTRRPLARKGEEALLVLLLNKSPSLPLFQRGKRSHAIGGKYFGRECFSPPLSQGEERGISGFLCALCAFAEESFVKSFDHHLKACRSSKRHAYLYEMQQSPY